MGAVCLTVTIGCGRSSVEVCEEPQPQGVFELRCQSRATCPAALTLPVAPPGLFLVVDRSPSMRRITNGVSKWDEAVAAVDGLVAQWAERIHWGLTLFPDQTPFSCRQGDIPVPVGLNQADAVVEHMDAPTSRPSSEGLTNTYGAIQQAFMYEDLRNSSRLHAVLLVTDGQTTCGNGQFLTQTDMVGRMWRDDGIRTFVVGFGAYADDETLSDLALAGGAPAAGATAYYEAGIGHLAPRLAEVLEQHLDCVYPVDVPSSQVNGLHVQFDGEEDVPRSTHDGWDRDAAGKFRFHGPACQRLRSFEVSTVDITLDCRRGGPSGSP